MQMFMVQNLKITGTNKQIEQYATDAKEYDYIKNSIEKITHAVKTKCSDKRNYSKFAKIGDSLFISAHSFDDLKHNPYILIYDAKEKTYTNTVSVNQLNLLKNKNLVDYIAERLVENEPKTRMVPEIMDDYAKTLAVTAEMSM